MKKTLFAIKYKVVETGETGEEWSTFNLKQAQEDIKDLKRNFWQAETPEGEKRIYRYWLDSEEVEEEEWKPLERIGK